MCQLILCAVTVPVGYVILHMILKLKLRECPVFVKLILYGVSGCIFSMSLLSVVGFLSMTVAVIILFSVLSVCSILIWKRHRADFNLTKLYSSTTKDIFTLCIIIFSFIVIGTVGVSWKWVPAGDSFGHEFLTGLILYHDRITPNFMPFNNNPLIYGPGLHSLSAFLSKIIGLYPGESVLLTGSFLTAFLPLLVYSFVYYRTSSLPLSLLAYCSTFLLHPTGDLQRWVFGYFFNGAYPPLGGMLFGLLLFLFLSIQNEKEPRFKKWIAIMYSFLGVAIVHYGFVPPLLSSVVILYIFQNRAKILNKKILVALVLVILVSIPAVYYLNIGNSYLFEHRNAEYAIQRSEVLASYSSVAILASTTLGLGNLIYGKNRILSICLLTVNIPLLLSSVLPPAIYGSTFGVYYLSLRMFNFASLFSWIFFAIMLNDLKFIDRIIQVVKVFIFRFKPSVKNSIQTFSKNKIDLIAIIIIIIIFSNVFIPYLSGKFIQIQAKPSSVLSEAEYGTMAYMAKNFSMNETILADPTRSSIHLLGFEPLNSLLNFPLLVGKLNQTRAIELTKIFEFPGRYLEIKNLLQKYNVSHLLVNDELKGYTDYFNAKRGERGEFIERSDYKSKPYSRDTYVDIFNHNPYLRLIYREKYSALYKVDLQGNENEPFSIISVSPSNHSTSVSPSTSIAVEFNKAIDAATLTNLTFSLHDESGHRIPGQINLDFGGYSATFKPNLALSKTSIYTAFVARGLNDWFGNQLSKSVNWSFTPADCNWLPRREITSSNASQSAGLAIDRKVDTAWISTESVRWLTLDVGSSKKLCAVYVAWYKGNEIKYDFNISISDDGIKYTRVFSGQSYDQISADQWQRYDLNIPQARFLKIDIINDSNNRASGVSEFAVKGLNFPAPVIGR